MQAKDIIKDSIAPISLIALLVTALAASAVRSESVALAEAAAERPAVVHLDDAAAPAALQAHPLAGVETPADAAAPDRRAAHALLRMQPALSLSPAGDVLIEQALDALTEAYLAAPDRAAGR
ncbi:MAG: hypothetical protein AAFX58_06040 [Pseudomonadota bacterium]